MPSLDTTVAFFGLALLLGFTPGPDNLFVLMQSATHGRRAGFLVVLGLCTGLLVHTAAVVLGLAAVFAASATAFLALKFLGAAYLAWLAWNAWHAPGEDGPHAAAGEQPPLAAGRLFLRGILMNITNPKVVLFFLALLPQFVEQRRGAVALQLVWLGLVFIVATLVSFGCITVLAARIGHWLRACAPARRMLNRLAAAVFAGLAARLALAER
jgi:threonine/homoserine/homoserine lactone efflux protein